MIVLQISDNEKGSPTFQLWTVEDEDKQEEGWDVGGHCLLNHSAHHLDLGISLLLSDLASGKTNEVASS